jgi:hypothetical protein
MIPKELKRDAAGLNRIDRIKHADQLVKQARSMAFACMADVDRGFSDFSDDDCPECATRAECGLHVYEDTLLDAADHYQAAGLVLLAERVRKIPQTCVFVAWGQFDSANAIAEV